MTKMGSLSEPLSSYDPTFPKKRTRVLLSCGPCRASKLKCDRGRPCVQCSKKGRASNCLYAPKPERKSPIARGVAARLKRLEGMVRNMMDDTGAAAVKPSELSKGASDKPLNAPSLNGQVIHNSDHAMTYVGATHCLAMLGDIEEIKAYFDNPDQSDDDASSGNSPDARAIIPFSRVGAPRSREDLLALVPEKSVSDKMIAQYFHAMTPTQYVIHRPTFMENYEQFWQDHDSVSLHWLSILFTVFVSGIYHNNYGTFFEERRYSSGPVKGLIKQYHSYAGWALIQGKYTQPTTETITGFLLYAESDFFLNPSEKSTCYILSGVCLRLMLKMGYHRDPSKLAEISPFEGEMRRRQWAMAIQLDSFIQFQMGLPIMLLGLESDTRPPGNYEDDDFGPSDAELPEPRPPAEYTYMSYTVFKLRLVNIFSKIAQQAHSLDLPKYSDVLALDKLHSQAWKAIPHFLRARPLEDCVGEPPYQIVQRLCCASFHYKSICVLHRRYLMETDPIPEHNYSRQQCLEAAIALLDFQFEAWEESKPGNKLGLTPSFINSLAIHDFLLAIVILYVIIQSEHYADDGTGFGMSDKEAPAPRKDELKKLIRRSYDINYELGSDEADQKKTAYALSFMLEKLGCPVETTPSEQSGVPSEGGMSTGIHSFSHMNATPSLMDNGSSLAFSAADEFEASFANSELPPLPPPAALTATLDGLPPSLDMNMDRMGGMGMAMAGMGMTMGGTNMLESNLDFPWALLVGDLEWRHLDASIARCAGGSFFDVAYTQPGTETFPPENMELVAEQLWNTNNSFNIHDLNHQNGHDGHNDHNGHHNAGTGTD